MRNQQLTDIYIWRSIFPVAHSHAHAHHSHDSFILITILLSCLITTNAKQLNTIHNLSHAPIYQKETLRTTLCPSLSLTHTHTNKQASKQTFSVLFSEIKRTSYRGTRFRGQKFKLIGWTEISCKFTIFVCRLIQHIKLSFWFVCHIYFGANAIWYFTWGALIIDRYMP